VIKAFYEEEVEDKFFDYPTMFNGVRVFFRCLFRGAIEYLKHSLLSLAISVRKFVQVTMLIIPIPMTKGGM